MSTHERWRIGQWDVDFRERTIRCAGVARILSPRAMDVLVELAGHPGEVVAGTDLLRTFWPRTVTSPNAVQKVITELRQALGNGDADTYIETVPKRGYRLVAPVANRCSPVDSPSRSIADASDVLPGTLENGASGRRYWLAVTVAAAACGIIAIAWFAIDTAGPRPRTIELGDRSALLTPASRNGYDDEERRVMEAIFDNVTGRLAARSGPVRSHTTKADVDYIVELEVDETNGRLHALTTIQPTDRQQASRTDEVDVSTAQAADLVERTSGELSENLAVLLDASELAKMRKSHATDVRAYRLARQADAFQRITTVESLNHAVALYKESIRLDPSFSYAYESLACAYWSIALTPPDNATREAARRALQALTRDAKTAPIDATVAAIVDRQYRMLSVGSAFDSEALWRHELLANPNDVEALRRYGELLMGAKLIDESVQYFQRATLLATQRGDQGLVDAIEPHYSGPAALQGNWQRAIEVNKVSVEKFPDFTMALYGLVLDLGKIGRYAEADTYLNRLQSSDATWAWAAEVRLRAERGVLPKGSQALREVLDDPRTSNTTRGEVCFAVGDVDCGVRYWHQMEAAYLPLEWLFTPWQEQFWAPGVVQDPRYQALLEELGIGKAWRTYMRAAAATMTTVTGVQVTTPPAQEDVNS